MIIHLIISILLCNVGGIETMQTAQFSPVPSGNADLAANPNIRNIGYYDSKIWWAEFETSSGGTMYARSVTSLTATTSTETSKAVAAGRYLTDAMVKIFPDGANTDIVLVGTYKSGTGAGWYMHYSDDAGSTWYDYNDGLALTGDYDCRILDVYRDSSGNMGMIWIPYGSGSAGSPTLMITTFNTVGATSTNSGLTLDSVDAAYGGFTDGDHYYCVYVDSSQDFYEVDVTISTRAHSETAISGLTEPGTYDTNRQQYFNHEGSYYLLDGDHFYYLPSGQTTWVNYSASNTTTIGVVWVYSGSNYEPAYFAWDDGVYALLEGGAFGKIQLFEASELARVGYEDWFADGTDTIYQLDFTSYICQGSVDVQPYTGPAANIITLEEPFENQFLQLYDNADKLVYQGFVRRFNSQEVPYRLTMVSGVTLDLEKRVTGSFTTQTAHYILKYFLDEFADFLWYNTGISTTPATTYTLDFDCTLRQVIEWADKAAGYFFSIRANYECYWNTYTASGETVTGSATEPSLVPDLLKLSKVILYGGYDSDGDLLKSVKYGEPNYGLYIKRFPQYTTQATLDALATQILSDQNKNIYKVAFAVYNEFWNYGTTLTLTLSQLGISAETYYIVSVNYNFDSKILTILAYDAYYIPQIDINPQDVAEQTEQALKAYVDTTIETLLGIGAANHQWHNCQFGTSYLNAWHSTESYVRSNTTGGGYVYWDVPLPRTIGSLKLYIDGFRTVIRQADASNYVDGTTLQGGDESGSSALAGSGTNLDSAGVFDYTFSAIDCSEKDVLKVYHATVQATGYYLRIAAVFVRYYYA